MIPHKTYLHNVLMSARVGTAAGHRTEILTWLPQYHDMGLIANYTVAPCVGATLTCMSPMTFLADPSLWMLCISEYQVHATIAPNFAYALVARKWKASRAKEDFDLSSLTFAGCGAEPINPDTMQGFIDLFSPHGFDPGALKGSYGLAETCVFCNQSTQLFQVLCKDGKRRFTVGNVDAILAGYDVDIRIVDKDEPTRELPLGEVGEICISSHSVAAGYFGNAEKTAETFGCRIEGVEGRGFLRTGDLGMLAHPDRDWFEAHPEFRSGPLAVEEQARAELDQRHLVITGREKDLIIINGRNYYPQELETAAEHSLSPEMPVLRPGCSVAVGITEDDTESVAIVIEVRTANMKAAVKQERLPAGDVYDAVCAEISQAITVSENVKPALVVLIEEKSIPKTTSGKVQRRKTREELLAGRLREVHRWKNPTITQEDAARRESRFYVDPDMVVDQSALQAAADFKSAVVAGEVYDDASEDGGDHFCESDEDFCFDERMMSSMSRQATRHTDGRSSFELDQELLTALHGTGLVDQAELDVLRQAQQAHDFTSRNRRSTRRTSKTVGFRTLAGKTHEPLTPFPAPHRAEQVSWEDEDGRKGLGTERHAHFADDPSPRRATKLQQALRRGTPKPSSGLAHLDDEDEESPRAERHAHFADDPSPRRATKLQQALRRGTPKPSAGLAYAGSDDEDDGRPSPARKSSPRATGAARVRFAEHFDDAPSVRRETDVQLALRRGTPKPPLQTVPDDSDSDGEADGARDLRRRVSVDAATATPRKAPVAHRRPTHRQSVAVQMRRKSVVPPRMSIAVLSQISAKLVEEQQGVVSKPTTEDLELIVRKVLLEQYPQFDFSKMDNLMSLDILGVSSVEAVQIATSLGRELNIEVEPTILYSCSTIDALIAHFLDELDEEAATAETGVAGPSDGTGYEDNEGIAIVGVGVRLPGGIDHPVEFWAHAKHGVDLVAASKNAARNADMLGGFIDRDAVEKFDSAFFGIKPVEADAMDPCQRLLLTTSWEALHMSGVEHPKELLDTDVGVFVGFSGTEHVPGEHVPKAFVATSTAASIAANRLSFVLGLTGPSLVIDTACSASLVAVSEAVRHIRSSTSPCGSAIVAGANLMHDPECTRLLYDTGFLSPTEKCHTFGAGADGYVRSEACVSMYLMRVSQAQREGRPILGVIRGTAVGQDGKTMSLTAPNDRQQAAMMKAALADARLHPSKVHFVECHGTGTKLGDPIEIKGIVHALCKSRSADAAPPVLSSAKSTVGHTEAAAGLVGLLKLTLSLNYRAVTGNPDVGAEGLNPMLTSPKVVISPAHFDQSTVVPDGEPIVGGVSSFGFGGTIAHVVVSELGEGERNLPSVFEADAPNVVFCFAGQGGLTHRATAPTMYTVNSAFAAAIDECAELLDTHLSPYTLHQLLAIGGAGQGIEETVLLDMAQPAIFAVQYATFKLWRARGVKASAVLGHSLGEIAAAVAAGAMTLQQACGFVAVRFREMNKCAGSGGMTAFIGKRPEIIEHVKDYVRNQAGLSDPVVVGGLNGPRQIVLSGTATALERAERDLAAEYPEPDLRIRKLKTAGAFHSPSMQPAADAVKAYLESPEFGRFRRPTKMVSTLTGKFIGKASPLDPEYWARQIVTAVDLEGAAATLVDAGLTCALEIGPARTLTSMLRHAVADASALRLFTTCVDPEELSDRAQIQHLRLTHARIDSTVVEGHPSRVSWNYRRFPLHERRPDQAAAKEETQRVRRQTIAFSRDRVTEVIAKLLDDYVTGFEIDENTPFVNMGLDSLALTSMASALSGTLGIPVTISMILGNPTAVTLGARPAPQPAPSQRG